MLRTTALAAGMAAATATTYMKETFDSADWESRWTVGSEWKSAAELGEWKWTGGKYAGAAGDKGIQTGQDARFYSLSAPLDAAFDNTGKDLIISYTVKHEQDLDCGGAYIKLLPGGFDKKKFGGSTPYALMFGPDVCGYSTRRTHNILTYKGENHLTKKNVKVETDRLSHRYTLILRPDNTYEVQIDGAKVESGKIEEDWDMLPPREIEDPEDKKPADWADEEYIPDPEDKKPEGYDDIPRKIPDPEAKQPEDWDEDEDGEWTAPQIDNPEFKPWEQRKMKNPAWKGVWAPRKIANPAFKEDDKLYAVCGGDQGPCAAVGFELWQVRSGTIFDDIIVTDSMAEAEAFAASTWAAKKDAEKAAFDKLEEEKRAKEEEERKKAEAEAASKKAEEGEEEDEEEEDEKEEL